MFLPKVGSSQNYTALPHRKLFFGLVLSGSTAGSGETGRGRRQRTIKCIDKYGRNDNEGRLIFLKWEWAKVSSFRSLPHQLSELMRLLYSGKMKLL